MTNDKKSENRVLFFRSVSSDFQYIQDVPSILRFDKRILIKSETGELIQNEKEPQWSLVLNCNKQTILNYGPWYDRQREALWAFFFPQTYGTAEPQPEPTLNESKLHFLILCILNFYIFYAKNSVNDLLRSKIYSKLQNFYV